MHHSHTLPVQTRSRTQLLVPLVIGVLAAALIVVALVTSAGDKPASSSVAQSVATHPASVARPSESAIAATVGRSAQPRALDEAAVTRKWNAYDQAIRSQPAGAKSLSQIKRDAQYLGAR